MKTFDKSKYSTNKSVASDVSKAYKMLCKEFEKLLGKYGDRSSNDEDYRVLQLQKENAKLKKEVSELKIELARLYDAKQTAKSENYGKALSRISKWANNPYQLNSTIIWSYFKAEALYGSATIEKMQKLCQKERGMPEKQFKSHYASLKTDAGNSDGKIFEDNGYDVWIWSTAKDTLIKYKSAFYKGN